MDYKIARAAAKWWIEEMTNRYKEIHPSKEIVDDSFSKELSRFESVLTEEIALCLKQHSYLSLTCYFIPNRALSNLVKKAHISTEYLPYRAVMQVCDNSVQVSLNGDDILRTLPMSGQKL